METSEEEKVKELVKEYLARNKDHEKAQREIKELIAPVSNKKSFTWQQALAFAKEQEAYEGKRSSIEAERDSALDDIERLKHEIGSLLPLKNQYVNMSVDGVLYFVIYKSDRNKENWDLNVTDNYLG